jgi:uncharacterized transporter YbjL
MTTEPLVQFLAGNPLVTMFAVTGIGYMVGAIRYFGFRLGVAGVLFTGLIPVPLPGGATLRLGLAGGPLIVGLI